MLPHFLFLRNPLCSRRCGSVGLGGLGLAHRSRRRCRGAPLFAGGGSAGSGDGWSCSI